MKDYSSTWTASKKPAKQRKYRAKAPLHRQAKLMHVALSSELRKKLSKRNMGIRVGDKVKIIKGDFKKQEGKVSRVRRTTQRIYIDGIERSKKDGTKISVGVRPAQVQITELIEDDKKRQEILKRK